MPQPTAAEIEKLCDDWCAASIVPGGFAIGQNTERFRLRVNGVVFHELSHEQLCATILGLSKVLLRPGMNTIIDQDHFLLWSWCGELLLSREANLFSVAQTEIKSLFETAFHAALADCRKPPATSAEWIEQNRVRDLQPHHAKQLVEKSPIVLAYLTFPLLEAVLKRACSNYVELNGRVIAPFSVLNRRGTPRAYRVNDSISSLRDLLLLHKNQVANQELEALLDRFRAHLSFLDSSIDPFDLLYEWRNQSLHGSASFQTIGGTVLSLSLLISLFEVRQNFEPLRRQMVERLRREAQSPIQSPQSFYPPYRN